jgi:hypothetical protein
MTRSTKILGFVLAAALTLDLSGCGWALYPERRGQTAGRIDPAVAILDGLGLLLFVVPGVVAFAVDFTTGAIYLPEGASRDIRGKLKRRRKAGLDVFAVAPRDLSPARLEAILERETGVPGILRRRDLQVRPLASSRRLSQELARAD